MNERFLKQFSIQFIITKSYLSVFILKMHILQPKHSKLKPDEIQELLNKYNISLSQLPKIKIDDAGLPEDCNVGDVIKIERKEEDGVKVYYRVVV